MTAAEDDADVAPTEKKNKKKNGIARRIGGYSLGDCDDASAVDQALDQVRTRPSWTV